MVLHTTEKKKLEYQKKFSLKDGFHLKDSEDRVDGSTQENSKENLRNQKAFCHKGLSPPETILNIATMVVHRKGIENETKKK